MMNPPIEALMERTSSKFALVTLSARRAREINSYFNQLGEGLGSMVPPQVSSTSRKPLSISFEEIAADKIKSVPMAVYEELEAEMDTEILDEAASDVAAVFGDSVATITEPVVEPVAEFIAEPIAEAVEAVEPTL
jgi:DNA-directed RNA polymerase subunit omega